MPLDTWRDRPPPTTPQGQHLLRRSPYSDLAPHVTAQRSLAVPMYSKWARGREETEEVRTERETRVRVSPTREEDGMGKKKARLGWGQGLAKYEKQKVDGSANSGRTSSATAGVAGSTSPVTPCSAACSSHAGMDMPFAKVASTENERTPRADAPVVESKSCCEEFPIKIDQLPPISTVISLLSDFMQPEEACSGDSSLTTNATLSKLLAFKAEIANELEKTEYEIDSYDNELKSLKVDQKSIPCQSARKSNVGETSSHGKEMPCVVIVNSENIPETEHAMVDHVVEKLSDENVGSSSGCGSNDLIASIMSSNKDAAKQAFEVFNRALFSIPENFELGSGHILSCRENDVHIKEKLALQKRQLKCKEKVLSLKFKVLHHLWKEDLKLLSVKKQRSKSQKRVEQYNRPTQTGFRKNRSSIQSGSTFPACNLTLVPTADIVKFTSKLSFSNIRTIRSNLKMPVLILDEKERACSMFITKNGLVEDSLSVEKERNMINPWSDNEKRVFMEMLATHGKDFTKISSFLSHKTTSDCIEFYYKNHKSESFRDVKKQLKSRKQSRCLPTNTYLVTTGKKLNEEANTASLDMLGAVSVIAANETKKRQKHARRPKVSLKTASSVETSAFDKEAEAADVLAGICGTLSSEGVSSCVTGSVSPAEKMSLDRPMTPGVTQINEEEDSCSDEDCGELGSVDWTDKEKSELIRGLRMYGRDFAKISGCVGTKSRNQCKNFFSKARKCLGLDMIQQETGHAETPSHDNGGKSDTDDACETASYSKMDVDLTPCVVNTGDEKIDDIPNEELELNTEIPESVSNNDMIEVVMENVQETNTLEKIGENNTLSNNINESLEKNKPIEIEDDSVTDERQIPLVIQQRDFSMQQVAQTASRASMAAYMKKIQEQCHNMNKSSDTFKFLNYQQLQPPETISCPQLASLPRNINFDGQLNNSMLQASRDFPQLSSLSNQFLIQGRHHVLSGYPMHPSSNNLTRSISQLDPRFVYDVSNTKRKEPVAVASTSISHREEQSTQVKLFGQILTNPSPLQKSVSSPLHSNAEIKRYTPSLAALDFPQPQRSYGYWDGNKIQTGYSSPFYIPTAGGNTSVLDFQRAYMQQRNRSGMQPQRRTAMARIAGVSDPVAAMMAATGRAHEMELRRTDLGGM